MEYSSDNDGEFDEDYYNAGKIQEIRLGTAISLVFCFLK